MSRKVTGAGNRVHKEPEATICRDDQSTKQFKPGDITWIKTGDCFWWPTQVVDERSVSFRPKKKVKDGVLVRIYGSYDYLHVDPVKCRAKFEKFLKKNSLSVKEAFQKAMDEDLSRLRSGGKSKRKVSESKEKLQIGTPKGKISKKQSAKEPGKTIRACTTKNSTPEEPRSNPNERRTRVMQSLGLIPPPGSPYRPNGIVITSSAK